MKVTVVFFEVEETRFGPDEKRLAEISLDFELLPRAGDQIRFHPDLPLPGFVPMALWEVRRAGFVVWPGGAQDVSLGLVKTKGG